MKTLRELTAGIASIVNTILGRVGTLEDRAGSQERRLDALEARGDQNFRSMEIEQERKVQLEVKRQDNLTENELREELNDQFGASKWSKRLIDGIIRKRRGNREH